MIEGDLANRLLGSVKWLGGRPKEGNPVGEKKIVEKIVVEYNKKKVGLRKADLTWFKACAALRNAYLLVRGTNSEALDYFCIAGYTPKPIEIKAKTAEKTPKLDGTAPDWTIAGLVADPTIVGPLAFGDGKIEEVRIEWEKTKPLIYSGDHDPVTGRPKQHLAGGKHFVVQMNERHKHYGCLMHSPDGVSFSRYIHGDYDLYDVVPAIDRHSNEFVRHPRYGWMAPGVQQEIGTDFQPHLFIETQTFLNANIGAPVVKHGDQAKYKREQSDEPVWAFFPGGNWEALIGRAAIVEFYITVLGGRKLEAVEKKFT